MAEIPPYKPGDRVQVPSFGLGTVRFCGTTQFQTGMWVGVQLDTANGKNDGSVKGVKYFECPPNYGLFVRPTQVQPLTGDTPPASPAPKPAAPLASAPSTPIASAPATPAPATPAPATPAPATPMTSVIPKPSASVSTPAPATPAAVPPSTPKAAAPPVPAPVAVTPKAAPPSLPTAAPATPKAAPPLPGGGAPPPLPGAPPPLPVGDAPAPGTPMSALTTSPELKRMLAELKELIEWKDKAQENIKSLTKQLAAATAQSQTLSETLEKEKKEKDRAVEKAQREYEREKERFTQASDKERADLQEALTAAKEQLEMAQLDQQIEAEKANQLEKELEQLRGKLEVLEAQQPKNVTVVEGATENERMLIGQCERLKEALMKLRDISVVEKQEHEKKLAEVQKRADEVARLEDKIQRMEGEMQKRLKEIEELKTQLDELMDAQRMVEELTEKNLNLEEYMAELKDNIKELEQLKEMSEELEENQQLVEKRLRSELYAKEIQLLDVQTTLENTRKQLGEQATTIDAFRFKVRNLERDLGEVRRREEEEVAQASQLNEKSQALLEQNMQLRNRAQEQLRRELEAAAAVLEARTARSQVALMRTYLPDDLQSDWAATEAISYAERIEGKAEMVVNEVKRAYKLFQAHEARSRFGPEEVVFAHTLCVSSIKAGAAARGFWEVLNRCEPETFLRLGSVLTDLKMLEAKLDALLKLISRDDLNEAYPIEEFNQLVDACNAAFAARAKGAVLLVPAWREYHAMAVETQHRVAAAETLAIALASSCGISAEAGLAEAREAAGACRSLTKTLADARRLLASDHIRTQLTAASASIQSLVATLSGALAQLKDKIGLQVDVSPDIRQSMLVSILQAFANKDGVSEAKLSADGLYELLVTAQLGAAHKLLVAAEQTVISALATADGKEVPDPTPAWRARATTIRTDIHSIPALRDRAEKAAAEVAERTKLVQQKEQEALEYARRETVYTQRLEALSKRQEELLLEFEGAKAAQSKQIKMYEDALEALRQEVAALESEGRDLKTKLISAESKATNAPKAARSLGGVSEASPEEVLTLKEALSAVLRENSTWRGQATVQEALFLPAPPKVAKHVNPQARADVAALTAQLGQLLAAPPMLSLAEKHGVREWEARWALRAEKLHEIQRRLAASKASTGSKS